MLNLDDRMLRLQPWENVPPPIGVGGGDSSAAAKALAGRDTALHQQGQASRAQARRAAGCVPSVFALVLAVHRSFHLDLAP